MTDQHEEELTEQPKMRLINPDAVPPEIRTPDEHINTYIGTQTSGKLESKTGPGYRGLDQALAQAVPIRAGQGVSLLTEGISTVEESAAVGRDTMSRVFNRIGNGLIQPRTSTLSISLPDDIDERPMVQHALRELRLLLKERAGEEAMYGEGEIEGCVVDLIRVVSSQGHSGGSIEVLLALFDKLVRRQNLTPLTDDPAEWMDMSAFGGGPATEMMRWQSIRNTSAFSGDGGKTHWRLDTGKGTATQPSMQVTPTGPHPKHS